MAKVEIVRVLFDEINKTFKKESIIVFQYLKSLKDSPKKGKFVGSVGGIIVKELKYKTFRFYFITDGFKLKCISKTDLTELLMKFVRMSKKQNQQETIDEIKFILRTIGSSGF
ncbi:hypothetical protein HOE22_11245 [Candidatus Woesearchaeota archaeon]|jgi:hypothetical protein|nr:hypothetical protein [Candidatus Woesearchaeota archaeon]MBT5043312.1 hypothetical protein [Candidatus Woesearchaeota archaeon]MBT5112005.1 hypothetical protein [Candidatus Woesearchaeota archaeon]MBT5557760.1 hypothetical protein [Candidatus Woesearchaeota archaeon]MBT6760721.1 hypothetical protein [Candidatus Woesearchaeota archaeon]